MGLEDPTYALRYKIRLGDTAAVRNILKAGEADPLAPSVTIQQWTPLHCAAWGSINLKSDKDIAEALLLWAQKAKKEKEIRDAVDSDGYTPLDLAKQQRETLAAIPPAPGANPDEGDPNADAKKKLDKIIEWLEKGLPA